MKIRIGLAIAMLTFQVQSALATEALEVSLGYSEVIGPVADMSTVIVGDNRVADATLGGGGTIILTGRSLGATNLIVLDQKGRELMASPLQVVPLDRTPRKSIRIVKGITDAQEYDCGPGRGCDPVTVAVAAPEAPAVDDSAGGAPAAATEAPATPVAPATPEGGDADTGGTPASPEQVSLNP